MEYMRIYFDVFDIFFFYFINYFACHKKHLSIGPIRS